MDLKRKYKEEMEGDHDNASSFMHPSVKKYLKTKVNFLNQIESFSYVRRLHFSASW